MLKEEKKLLRNEISRRKKTTTETDRKEWSKRLLELIENHPLFKQASTLLLYHSLPDEVQTHEFIDKWSKQKKIILPVVKGDDLELRVYTGTECLQKGAYNIDEPTGELFREEEEIELAIIPGVSFDNEGNRLGRGKGYYDRLLARISPYKIGICFQFQVAENTLPHLWMKCGAKTDKLSKDDIIYHLRTYPVVKVTHQQFTVHQQLLTNDGRRYLHIKGLVLDKHITRITCNGRTHYIVPRINYAELVERSFKSLLT